MELLARLDEFQMRHPSFFGVFYALMSALSNSIQVFAVKGLTKGASYLQLIQYITSVVTVLVFAIQWIFTRDTRVYGRDSKMNGIVLIRAFSGLFGYIGTNYGIKLLPPQVFIVFSNSNMIFAILITCIVARQYPNKVVLLLCGTFFLGIVMMVNPELLFLKDPDTHVPEYNRLAVLIPLLGGLANGTNIFLLQQHAASLNPLQNLFWGGLFANFATGVLMTAKPPKIVFTIEDYLVCTLAALCNLGSMLASSAACRYEKRPEVITPLMSSAILMTFLIDILVLGKDTDYLHIIGAFVIFLSCFGIAALKGRVPPKPSGK